MTYQVIANPRTGSSLLNHYALHYNEDFGFNELFLENNWDLDIGWRKRFFTNYSIEEKLEFIEFYKSKNIHFSFKFMPHQILETRPDLENRMIEFFKGYKNLTIHRDPWDSFLSLSYQTYTKWQTSHNWVDKGVVDVSEYKINLTTIKPFVIMYNMNMDFISKVKMHKVFKYEEITTKNLQKFFNTDWDSGSFPMNLDYRAKAINIQRVKEIFDYEMYGTRNRNNN